MELNHKHSRARFKTGVFLLQNLMEGFAIQGAFDNILQAAHMKRAHNPRSFFGAGDQLNTSASNLRSRSRSHNKNAGQDNSYILNNITSLLSPTNLRKIEQKNLYQKQIDSFYTPAGNNVLNNSSVVIQTMPEVQLKPQFHNNV